MKRRYSLPLVGLLALAAAAPSTGVFADIAVQIKGPLQELTALDEEEKQLRTSEQAQVYASEGEKKDRARIDREYAQWKIEGAQADQMRERILASGCPEHRTMGSVEEANRCNPQYRAHRELYERLEAQIKSLLKQREQVDQLRRNISATVEANALKRKRIDADRARLTAERDRLQALAIAELIKRNKLAAAKACTNQCCRSVIFDGANPKLCGVSLVCQSFENAGLFGSTNRICSVGALSVPAIKRTDGAAAKKPWEIEYERKEAIYKQELAKQQQAVAQYERDKAALERTRAEQRARAEKAQADWRAAVAACKAGDYSNCAR